MSATPPPVDAALHELRRLVAFPTITRGPNLELIEHARERLEGLGVPCHRTFDDTGTKANLFASFGPTDRPGVVLSGHTDVVPVEGQDWSSDPFEVVEREGRHYGRGTADMKSFLAVPLAMAEWIAGQELKRPLHLALSYDEEIGCVGVRRMLAKLGEYCATPAACIVGEPTGMRVMTGHKGKRMLRCRVKGVAGHSSHPERGVNAIEHAAELVVRLRAVARRLMREGPFDEGFDPPFTTLQTGTIRGGVAVNIVPADCVFELEVRHLPGHAPEAILEEAKAFAERELLPEMRAVSEEAGFAWEEVVRYPGLDTPVDADVVKMVSGLVGEEAPGRVSFGSEAGLFSGLGVPSVVCGPGSIAQAHRPDEFVEREQVARCQEMVERLVAQLATA
ncbi:MAG TPA: acetylornithine deacetylase [Polyangiaceae bacterium LLY-WYZ-15_(1-7)]|nr:acetylornithine deacetylase [Myxococcales bacterium]MAT25726.1 acetylornithine deacetylase [Sandaracinus sp.]HJK89446.1 acetylornithine deacetylase [Polyangiaceae bacterium LLY-WYZ-15_(1-7)]MBJ71673.1 acetylornithine deacetylase [Sandaracinus sp.]HJK99800.1 acetylornithine deacetylase [Polyangiaceae bacterium LLY-WYZ-15_(1-7)]